MADVEVRAGTSVTAFSADTLVADLTSDYYWYRKDGIGPKYVEVALAYSSAPSAVVILVEHSMGGIIWNELCRSTDTTGETLAFFAPQGFFRIRVLSGTFAAETVTATVLLTNNLDIVDPEFESVVLNDSDLIKFGDANDATIGWDGSALEILPKTDDTGSFNVGDGTTDFDFKVFLGTTGDYVSFDVGDKAIKTAGAVRLELAGVGTDTDGSIIRAGTSGSKLVDDSNGANFLEFNFDTGATGGWGAGMMLRVDNTGAEASFTGYQLEATISAKQQNYSGMDVYTVFGSAGQIWGGYSGLQSTLAWYNGVIGGAAHGAYRTAKFAFNESASTNITNATRVSFLELALEGSAAAVGIEDHASGYAISLVGFTAAAKATNPIITNTAVTAGTVLDACLGLSVGIGTDGDGGSQYWIPLVPDAEWQ